jgi:glycosyltransferase involved in cell wall biosynthesis
MVAARAPKNGNGEITIVYTGAVYSAHFDAFRQLLAALKIMNRPEVKLHIYTLDPISILREQGIDGPSVVFKEYQELEVIPRIQQQADILFLPLAFDSPFPEIIRTSAPGKMGELLAARRPILVSAPGNSFVAWYFRQHECGYVFDERDPVKLAGVIEQLIRDNDLRRRLTTHAWERARDDFSLVKARSKFAELLGIDIVQSNTLTTN